MRDTATCRTNGLWMGAASLAAVAGVLALFSWTSWTSAGLPPSSGHLTDYYSELVHGLLKGHLYLDVPVDPAMVAAKDPYQYEVWRPHGWMVDASFFRGHYYLYFGIVPAILLLLPYHLATGVDLSLGTAVFCSAALAFLAGASLWWRICVRCFPRSALLVPVSGIVLFGANAGLLADVRRPNMYELPIATGLLFLALAGHCLLAALTSERPLRWLAAAGLGLGLAAGCRPPLLLAGVAGAWVALFGGIRPRWTALTAFGAGAAVVVAGLLAYNQARFGNPLEFGFRYQLTDPPASARHFLSAAYLNFNWKSYFLAPIHWQRLYPFFTLTDEFRRPSGYFLSEWVYGQLRYTPVLWFAPASWLLLSVAPSRAGLALFGLLVGSWAGPLLLDLLIESSAVRYLTDFLPFLLLTATAGFAWIFESMPPTPCRFALGSLWTVALLVSVGVAGVVSVPLYGAIVERRGADFQTSVARALNLPSFWYERLRGWHYGPMAFTASAPASAQPEILVATGNGDIAARTLPDGRLQVGLRFADGTDRWGVPVPAGNRRHRIAAAFGTLYPAASHPYYNKHPCDPADECRLELDVDGQPVLKAIRLCPPGDCCDIRVVDRTITDLVRNRYAPQGDFELSPGIRTSLARPQTPPASDGATLRLQVALPPDDDLLMRDPILVWGRPGAVDAVTMIYYSAHQVRFAFDHWGLGPFLEGSIVDDARRDVLHEIRVRLVRRETHPEPSGQATTGQIQVWFDGRPVMDSEGPLYRSSPADAAIGVNRLHVSGETHFHGSILLAQWLP